VNYFEPYKLARINIENRFKGLLHAHTTLIKSLITLANPLTGIVTNITYRDIAELLTVNRAPGRTESGTPQKETIRSYLRSIEKQCSEDFKIISEGQKLKFQFPTLPGIYASFLETTGVYTGDSKEQSLSKHSEKYDKNDELESFDNTQKYTELYTDQYTPDVNVKKLFINNKTNNNNILGKKIGNKNTPQTISQNFYPSKEIITRAIAAGHNNATDADIIQEFIDKNTAWGSTFADFNPIYLSFLAKHAERKQQESVISNTQTRSKDNERASPKINSYDAALEEVRRNNQNACTPSTDKLFPTSKAIVAEPEHSSHFMALGGTNQDLRRFFSY
jgi:hypothetical protein